MASRHGKSQPRPGQMTDTSIKEQLLNDLCLLIDSKIKRFFSKKRKDDREGEGEGDRRKEKNRNGGNKKVNGGFGARRRRKLKRAEAAKSPTPPTSLSSSQSQSPPRVGSVLYFGGKFEAA